MVAICCVEKIHNRSIFGMPQKTALASQNSEMLKYCNRYYRFQLENHIIFMCRSVTKLESLVFTTTHRLNGRRVDVVFSKTTEVRDQWSDSTSQWYYGISYDVWHTTVASGLEIVWSGGGEGVLWCPSYSSSYTCGLPVPHTGSPSKTTPTASQSLFCTWPSLSAYDLNICSLGTALTMDMLTFRSLLSWQIVPTSEHVWW